MFDKALYRALVRAGHMTEADMPSIDWDGTADVIYGERLVKADVGTFPSWDEGFKETKKRGGLPPNRVLGHILFSMVNRRVRDIRASAI